MILVWPWLTRAARVGGAGDVSIQVWPTPTAAPTGSIGDMIDQLSMSISRLASGKQEATAHEGAAIGITRLQRTMGLNGTRWNGTRRVPMGGDVVAFLTRVHALIRTKVRGAQQSMPWPSPLHPYPASCGLFTCL